jgi:hypothetical protein
MYILTILNQTHQFTARKPKFLKPLMINLNNIGLLKSPFKRALLNEKALHSAIYIENFCEEVS